MLACQFLQIGRMRLEEWLVDSIGHTGNAQTRWKCRFTKRLLQVRCFAFPYYLDEYPPVHSCKTRHPFSANASTKPKNDLARSVVFRETPG